LILVLFGTAGAPTMATVARHYPALAPLAELAVTALVAGLMLGLAETAVARLVDPGLTIAVTYALFLVVLLWRPTGLFGRAAR